jgi:heme/copper-type cytochrome/quinol oxidase subunit 2
MTRTDTTSRTGPLGPVITWVVGAVAALKAIPRRGPLDPEAGVSEIAQSIALAALGVLAAVVIVAALQVLGVDVIDMIRDNIMGGGGST